ncbi:MAG: hypothetical protein Q3965_05960, partial [Rothia sp. (in: high G+C Gram-positive bacteria)]|nr:hypothetical protein [Rothia sp. (in: high G+C Gram-positive bacteria)]
MGFWKNALLVAGGVAAGYFASRSTAEGSQPSQELVAHQVPVIEKFAGKDSPVARLLDSKYGAPLKSSVLGVLRFAATVKAG